MFIPNATAKGKVLNLAGIMAGSSLILMSFSAITEAPKDKRRELTKNATMVNKLNLALNNTTRTTTEANMAAFDNRGLLARLNVVGMTQVAGPAQLLPLLMSAVGGRTGTGTAAHNAVSIAVGSGNERSANANTQLDSYAAWNLAGKKVDPKWSAEDSLKEMAVEGAGSTVAVFGTGVMVAAGAVAPFIAHFALGPIGALAACIAGSYASIEMAQTAGGQVLEETITSVIGAISGSKATPELRQEVKGFVDYANGRMVTHENGRQIDSNTRADPDRMKHSDWQQTAADEAIAANRGPRGERGVRTEWERDRKKLAAKKKKKNDAYFPRA